MDDFSRFAPAYFTYMADCLDNDVRDAPFSRSPFAGR